MVAVLGLMVANSIFVSPNGRDTWPGTESKPVASLERAVLLARSSNAHVIVVGNGEYRQSATLSLDQRDNGLTIEAKPGARPVVTGSVTIPDKAITKVADAAIQARVAALDAGAAAYSFDVSKIAGAKLSPYVPYGFPRPIVPGPSELFADGRPLTIARWPNVGFAKIKSVSEPGNGENDRDKPPRMPVFLAESDRSKSWKSIDNAWLYGYWKYDWADETIKIQAIDPNTGAITLATPHTYGVDPGARFFIENAPEELDAVGEYFCDPQNQTVTFVRKGNQQPKLRLSLLGDPLIKISGADGITIRGLDFAFSRGNGAEMINCTKTRFEGCQFYNLGERAVVIGEGHDSGLLGCNIWNTAHGGVVLSGGDRKTLTPARLFVDNCDIHDYQRRAQTYRPAVLVHGVGNRVTHCALHDAPHSAIIFGGNDHLFEFNELFRTVSLTGDGGVVYGGRDWTARGTAIKDNYFHDNIGLRKWEPAIYFDDQISGLSAIGNVIERCHWGFLIGGGRDNIIADNQIIDCDLAMSCDARGLGWAARSKDTMVKNLQAVPYQSEIWRKRYPELVDILLNDPMAPAGNIIRGNELIRSGTLKKQTEAPFEKTASYSRNTESQVGSKRSTAQMGLVNDKIRQTLPK